jgi:hypothetical protein
MATPPVNIQPQKNSKHFPDQLTQVLGLIAFCRFGVRPARKIVNLSDTST